MNPVQNNLMSRRRLLGSFAALGAVAVVPNLASCSSSGSSATGGGTYKGQFSASLYDFLPDNMPLIVGLSKGYFNAVDLDLEPVSFSSGPDVIRSIATQTKLGQNSAVAGLVAFANGFPKLRIIGTMLGSPSIVFMVKGDSSVESMADLKGKKIGVSAPTSVTTYLATQAVTGAGLDPESDVELIDAKGLSDAATALDQGIFDCVWSSPPLAVQLEQEGKTRIVYDTAVEATGFVQSVLYSDADFISKNKSVVQHWVEAVSKSSTFVRENPEEAGTIWAKEIGVSTETGVHTATTLAPSFDVALSDEGFQQNVDACLAMGLIPEPIERDQIVDDSFGAGGS